MTFSEYRLKRSAKPLSIGSIPIAASNVQLSPVVKAVVPAILIIVSGFVALAQQTPPPTGTLKGVVVDWQYARVLHSCLTVKNKTIQKKVIVDPEGGFEVELPAGTYEVVAQSPGFRRFRRHKLQIDSNTTTTLNIMLEVAPEISGRCPAGTIKTGRLCTSLCEANHTP
ncbi:MAG TPA: carboxypeptidase-like regulatory domain-containing protein [Pyrinomonadaceae bacterium]|nr:carboxypeptidase-like regulatory domain-containing protein [Pyrinomonadaceae bacterium]